MLFNLCGIIKKLVCHVISNHAIVSQRLDNQYAQKHRNFQYFVWQLVGPLITRRQSDSLLETLSLAKIAYIVLGKERSRFSLHF